MNRREFIIGAAAVAAGGANVFAEQCCATRASKMLFGACRSSVDDVKAMRDLGASGGRVLVQGRDEAQGLFIPSHESIAP